MFRSYRLLVILIIIGIYSPGSVLSRQATWTKEQWEYLESMKVEYVKKIDDLSKELDIVKHELNVTKEKQRTCQEKTHQPRLLLEAPVKVAFNAHLSSNKIVASHQAVMYDIITINDGDSYDESKGQFRAPVSGTYHFVNTVMSLPGHGIHVNVVKNGVVIGRNWADREGYESGTVAVITHLNAGDTVWVRDDDSGSESLEHDYNNFSGFLLYQD